MGQVCKHVDALLIRAISVLAVKIAYNGCSSVFVTEAMVVAVTTRCSR